MARATAAESSQASALGVEGREAALHLLDVAEAEVQLEPAGAGVTLYPLSMEPTELLLEVARRRDEREHVGAH